MADTYTTGYSFTKPEEGGSSNTWGEKLNANWDAVDAILRGATSITGLSLTGDLTTTANINFGDNDKAIFGAGSDLQIYHDTSGNHSQIKESGTGNLQIWADDLYIIKSDGSETKAQFNSDSHVRLFYDGYEKFRTTSTGIDVTGTVVADGLTVSGATEFQDNPVIKNGSPELTFSTTNPAHANWQIAAQENLSNAFEIASGQQDADASDDTWSKRLTVLNNGDISFYDTTGTNASFVYDASTELVVNQDSRDFDFRVESDANSHAFFVRGSDGNVGIGTSSPSNALHIAGSASNEIAAVQNTSGSGGTARLKLYNNSDTNSNGFQIINNGSDGVVNLLNYKNTDMAFWTNTSERMRIDSSGRVGIGTSSPDVKLTITDTTSTGANAGINVRSTGDPFQFIQTASSSGLVDYAGIIAQRWAAAPIVFSTAGSSGGSFNERMRIDSSGTLIHKAAAVFNEDSNDSDFRVESDTNTHALFVDSGLNNVGIKTSLPGRTLDVEGGARFVQEHPATTGAITLRQNSGDTVGSYIQWVNNANSVEKGWMVVDTSSNMIFATGSNERMRIAGNGDVTINENGHDVDFRVESDTNTHALFVAGSSGNVGIGTSTVSSNKVTIEGGVAGTHSSTLALKTGGGTSRVADLAFYSTFYNYPSDTGHRRSADITSGYSTGTWGTEYLAFGVGGATDNAYVTTERMRIDANGRVGIGTSSPQYKGQITNTSANNVTDVLALHNGANPSSSGTGARLLFKLANFESTTENRKYASIEGVGTSAWNESIALVFKTQNSASNGDPIERMRIAGNGDVTINEGGNNSDFRVESDANTNMLFVDAGNNRVGFGTGSPSKTYDFRNGDVTIYGGEDGYNANGEKARLWIGNNNANVGAIFGTGLYLDPGNGAGDDAFQVRQGSGDVYLGSGSAGTKFIKLLGKSNGHIDIGGDITTSDNRIVFYNPNGLVGSIKTSSSGTTYNTSSDRRLKDNIETITDGTEKLMAMNPVRHTWLASPDAPAIHGFIAQEMQTIVPEAVSGEDGGEEMMSMDYGRIAPVVVAALQDAHRKIQSLEARIAQLEG